MKTVTIAAQPNPRKSQLFAFFLLHSFEEAADRVSSNRLTFRRARQCLGRLLQQMRGHALIFSGVHAWPVALWFIHPI
jgi:hypothetical protein